MSVDGDLSYFSGEMDETTTNNLINKDTVGLLNKKSSVFAPKTVVQQAPLKFKEANSSLHMIQRHEEGLKGRIFIEDINEQDQSKEEQKNARKSLIVKGADMEVIQEEEDQVQQNEDQTSDSEYASDEEGEEDMEEEDSESLQKKEGR